jgi:hypothetical protein
VRSNPPGSAASVTIAHVPRASRQTPQMTAMLQPGPVKRQ